MSYYLDPGEKPAAGIRRIVREQLERALHDATALHGPGETEAVHRLRKRIKKIRAVLRLIKEELGAEIYDEEKNRLRSAARGFSALRDAQVQLQVLEKIRAAVGGEAASFAGVAACFQQQLDAAKEGRKPERAEAIALLESLSDRLPGWPLEALNMKTLSCAFARSYRQGRRDLHHVLDHRSAENFHSWRKRSKEVWYHALLLRALQPEVLGEIAAMADTLGARLGDLHDLFFLQDQLPGCAAPEEEKAILQGLICTRAEALKEIALDLGARFFAEKPGAFRRRLLRYAENLLR